MSLINISGEAIDVKEISDAKLTSISMPCIIRDPYDVRTTFIGSDARIQGQRENRISLNAIKLEPGMYQMKGLEVLDLVISGKKTIVLHSYDFNKYVEVFDAYTNYVKSSYEPAFEDFSKASYDFINKYENYDFQWTDSAMDLMIRVIYKSKSESSKKSSSDCYITTAICRNSGKPDNCYELSKFREFRDNWLINQNDGVALITKYYETAPDIVKKIDNQPNKCQIYEGLNRKYLSPCLKYIENKEYSKCKELYSDMVYSLYDEYKGS